MPASLFGAGVPTYLNAESSLAREKFVPTTGQTLFTLSVFSYIPGTNSIWIFKNKLKLENLVDYVETSGGAFTTLIPALSTDEFEVIGFPIAAVTVVDNTIFHSFPFFTSGGVPNNIPLNSSGQLPFFKSDLTPSNIPII